mmetsp:Transcript_25638/g.22651  ORF Transcript_25638/g.22651 Transcript_25638/m.22651 type:complete len:229 (+) Transcript_25638:36-722(+)
MRISKSSLVFIVLLGLCLADDCSTFDYLNGCSGNQTEYPSDWDEKNFQTPPRGDAEWRVGFQDYHAIQGYVRYTYTQDKSSVTLNFTTKLNPRIFNDSSSYTIYYVFGTTNQTDPIFTVDNTQYNDGSVMEVGAYAYDSSGNLAYQLQLDPLDFIWNHPTVNTPGNYKKGQKGAIIEMFGWPYADIEAECEALGKMGYLGVKVYPPNEAIRTFNNTENGELNPWWYVY